METQEVLDLLWTAYKQQGDQEARERLIRAYIPLARQVVKRMGVPGTSYLNRDDLVCQSIIGLIESVERFDPDRGIRFECYAVPRIRGAVADALRSMDWAPRLVRKHEEQLRRAERELSAQLGRTPTDEELAGELGITVDELNLILQEISQVAVVSLEDYLIGDDSGHQLSVLDSLTSDDNLEADVVRGDICKHMHAAVANLPERERLVVTLYYYENLTLKEVGQVLGVSEARACQLHGRAMSRLRTALLALGLETVAVA